LAGRVTANPKEMISISPGAGAGAGAGAATCAASGDGAGLSEAVAILSVGPATVGTGTAPKVPASAVTADSLTGAAEASCRKQFVSPATSALSGDCEMSGSAVSSSGTTGEARSGTVTGVGSDAGESAICAEKSKPKLSLAAVARAPDAASGSGPGKVPARAATAPTALAEEAPPPTDRSSAAGSAGIRPMSDRERTRRANPRKTAPLIQQLLTDTIGS
jgi:hypothetical protein